MYTSIGSGPRRAPSPLLDWVTAAGARLLAAQLPGRASRRGDPYATSAQAVAAEIFPLIASSLADAASRGAPWAAVGHSLGAWLAFELAALAASARLPPARLIVSAMPAPDTPMVARPWTAQASLDSAGFAAECRAWGIADAVFAPSVWAEYEPLLRADFRLFDEYAWRGGRREGRTGRGVARQTYKCLANYMLKQSPPHPSSHLQPALPSPATSPHSTATPTTA